MSDEIMSSPAVDAAAPTDLAAIENEVLDTIPGDVEDDASDLDPVAAVDAAVKAGDISKKEAVQLKKTLKIKVDGEESDMDIDFSNDEDLKKHLQKSKAFDKRAKEHSAYKAQVDQMLQMLKDDPDTLLEKLGLDVDKFAESRLSKKIEELKKSPEELEAAKMRKELEDYKKREKESTDKAQKAEMERMKNQQAQQIESDISDALSSSKSILPKRNPQVLQRIAQTMYMAMTNGYPNVTAKDVIPLVEKQWEQELNSLFGESSEDVLERLVGKANLDKYRKAKVANRKAPPAQAAAAKAAAKDTGTKATVKEEPVKRTKWNDVFSKT